MAVKADDAIAAARALLGTPYAELDCINLIKKVIRSAPGGKPGYTTAGTNSLWRSYDAAAKYRDLTWRQEGIFGAQAGMLAFKANGEDYHHVGLITGEGTVIHSSSTQGGRGVVETPLTSREGWTHLAVHRYIQTAANAAETEESMAALYKARVVTEKDPLNVRQVPEVGKKIGKIPKGETVDVYTTGSWVRVKYGDMMGYVASEYLERIAEEEEAPKEENVISVSGKVTIIDGAGNTFKPVGGWRVVMPGND